MVESVCFLNGGLSISQIKPKWPSMSFDRCDIRQHSKRSTGDFQMSPNSINQDAESFLINAINMSFLEPLIPTHIVPFGR
ncbi:hypothetical protein RchiOBHm_Chr5g0013451 [Rosa chinensis]|uniref:Uncharacterized protein n=1 Tax=Rosa chinensis TaxID=74649 RepID=A0A2P6Q5D4_ROSCH|nr:hypothetical protein RchiOBHm_Chr5g0013451 [Rosa chinensis]